MPWENILYMNVELWIAPSHFMPTKSDLCGASAYLNGGACGSLVNKAGLLESSYGPVPIAQTVDFANSWAVPNERNLFENKWTTSVPEWRSMFKDDVPTNSQGATLKARGFVSQFDLYKRTERPLPDENKPISLFKREMSDSKARKYCKRQVSGGDCKSVVNPLPFIEGCVFDALKSSGFEFAVSAKRSFLDECLAVTNRMISSGDETQRALGLEIQISNGLNNHACPSACVGSKCEYLGCVCSQDKYGMFCKYKKSEE
jgi:hypothetical protein